MNLQETLDLAAAEGVVLRVRRGRISCRGTSPTLSQAVVENEKALVEYLGGVYRSPWLEIANDNEGVRR